MNDAAAPPPSSLEVLYGALFRPRETFLQTRPDFRSACLIAVLVAVVSAFGMAGGNAGLLPLAFITSLGLTVIGWLVMAGGLFVAGRILYHRGEFEDLAGAVGASLAPWLLLGPIEV